MAESWLGFFPSPRPGARFRLLCLPHAGGGASTFRAWSAEAPAWLDICALQLPGREARLAEPPYREMRALISALTEALSEASVLPYALFGHSVGALIAFEWIRSLRRRGLPLPSRLFVSSCPAPNLPVRARPLHREPDAALVEQLAALGGLPQEAQHPELLPLVLPAFRADLALAETYAFQPEPPLPLGISAFGGRSDPHVPRSELEAWREQTQGPFSLHLLAGDHFYLHGSRTHLLAVIARLLAPWASVG